MPERNSEIPYSPGTSDPDQAFESFGKIKNNWRSDTLTKIFQKEPDSLIGEALRDDLAPFPNGVQKWPRLISQHFELFGYIERIIGKPVI